MADGRLFAIDPETEQTRWTAHVSLPGFPATPLYARRGTLGGMLIVPFGNTGGPPSPG
jgi:hypothetical protein